MAESSGKSSGKSRDKTTPMDPSARERAIGTQAQNHPRPCWAMKTLIAEVMDLFPETTYEESGYDGRNTALDVVFDVHECPDLARLLECVRTDDRVVDVDYDQHGQMVLVAFRAQPRMQDSREPFGLADAWSILIDEEAGTGTASDGSAGGES